VNEDNKLVAVFEVSLDKDKIYEKLISWIKENFRAKQGKNNPDSKINEELKDNNELYVISGVGDLIIQSAISKMSQHYFFNYKFEIKDNKFRILLSDFYLVQPHFQTGLEVKYDASVQDLKKFILKDFNFNKVYETILKGVVEEKKSDDKW